MHVCVYVKIFTVTPNLQKLADHMLSGSSSLSVHNWISHDISVHLEPSSGDEVQVVLLAA